MRIYSAYSSIDQVADGFDQIERELWADIVEHLERFEP